jgi:hypothetical protein
MKKLENIYGFALLCCSLSIVFRHFSDSDAFLGTFPVAAVDRQSEKLFSNYANRSGSLTLQVYCACLTKKPSGYRHENHQHAESTAGICSSLQQIPNSINIQNFRL